MASHSGHKGGTSHKMLTKGMTRGSGMKHGKRKNSGTKTNPARHIKNRGHGR